MNLVIQFFFGFIRHFAVIRRFLSAGLGGAAPLNESVPAPRLSGHGAEPHHLKAKRKCCDLLEILKSTSCDCQSRPKIGQLKGVIIWRLTMIKRSNKQNYLQKH